MPDIANGHNIGLRRIAHHWIGRRNLAFLKEWQVLVLPTVFALTYVIGVIIDRVADSPFRGKVVLEQGDHVVMEFIIHLDPNNRKTACQGIKKEISMNHRMMLFLIGLMITGCIATGPVASATPTAISLPSPTITLTLTSTPTPLPTISFTPTSAFPLTGREIIFEESGNRNFTGTLYGEGETAIILANMSVGGEKQWDPFVAAADKQKLTMVTFNYRSINDVGQDMDLILGRLKEEGFERVICIGASLGTRACNSIARESEIAGIVLIAGSVHHASVAEATYPKMFISGALDVWAFDIEMGYEKAAEPKTLVLFENNRAHGTDLFSSKDGDQLLTLLVDFVNSLANP